MMTKNILISGGPLAAAQDSKPKVLSSKPGQTGFSAVMEQAVGQSPKPKAQSPKPGRDFESSSRPVHARSTRAAARGRNEEGVSKAERVVEPGRSDGAPDGMGSTLAEPGSKFKVQSSKPEQAEFSAVEEQEPQAATASKSPESGKVEASSEDEEISSEVTLVAEEELEEVSEVPSNIVAFPGVVAAVSNIIPFPLLAAPVVSQEQSVTLTLEGSKSRSAPVLELDQSPKIEAQRSTLSTEGFKPEDVQDGGMDVSSLGLKPVTERESAELSRSVSLMPKPATDATPNEATAVSASSNVIEVAFRTATLEQAVPVAQSVTETAARAQTQLPGEAAKLAESAPLFSSPESSAKIVLLRTDAAKTAAGVGLPAPMPFAAEREAAAGIGAAKQGLGMESTMKSEREKVAAEGGDSVLEALPLPTTSSSGRDVSFADSSARTLMATEWQTGRTDVVAGRSDSDSQAQDVRAIDGTGTVDRIASLMVRESALVKKHGSDSMAVVLRPDAETELFVHLSQRDGQIEATVRCERGDVQHLGALWSQLQESLAQHKVRLAPLQDAPSGQSNFNQSPGSGMSSGQNGTREETRPEKQFMDERSAPAATQTSAPHVRGAGGSRSRRITTSRPGWETWA